MGCQTGNFKMQYYGLAISRSWVSTEPNPLCGSQTWLLWDLVTRSRKICSRQVIWTEFLVGNFTKNHVQLHLLVHSQSNISLRQPTNTGLIPFLEREQNYHRARHEKKKNEKRSPTKDIFLSFRSKIPPSCLSKSDYVNRFLLRWCLSVYGCST